ncbi:hypothetical protein Tco_1142801 [Tanacetum coccineum]
MEVLRGEGAVNGGWSWIWIFGYPEESGWGVACIIDMNFPGREGVREMSEGVGKISRRASRLSGQWGSPGGVVSLNVNCCKCLGLGTGQSLITAGAGCVGFCSLSGGRGDWSGDS